MYIEQISPFNKSKRQAMQVLLVKEGIQEDRNLEDSFGLFDQDDQLMATASTFKNTIRCLAVDQSHQGLGLINRLLTHVLEHLLQKGYHHVFIYTKPIYRDQFRSLGFTVIAEVPDTLLFMENQAKAFDHYLEDLKGESPQAALSLESHQVGAIVMNANPFTKGHLALIEHALQSVEWLHLFVVSEDQSEFPFALRRQLVQAGISHLDRVTLHETGPYLVSTATFPSYFLKEEDLVIQAQVRLEAQIFSKIANQLGIGRRFLGSEPKSRVTGLYNQGLKQYLSPDIEVIEIERVQIQGQVISASTVRQLLKEGKIDQAISFLPETTAQFLRTDQGQAIIDSLKAKENIIHY